MGYYITPYRYLDLRSKSSDSYNAHFHCLHRFRNQSDANRNFRACLQKKNVPCGILSKFVDIPRKVGNRSLCLHRNHGLQLLNYVVPVVCIRAKWAIRLALILIGPPREQKWYFMFPTKLAHAPSQKSITLGSLTNHHFHGLFSASIWLRSAGE